MITVVFTKNNARILKGYRLPNIIHQPESVVVNADLSRVAGVPPHFWKLENGLIVEMTRFEKKARLRQHWFGVDNNHLLPLHGPAKKPSSVYYYLLLLIPVAIATVYIYGQR